MAALSDAAKRKGVPFGLVDIGGGAQVELLEHFRDILHVPPRALLSIATTKDLARSLRGAMPEVQVIQCGDPHIEGPLRLVARDGAMVGLVSCFSTSRPRSRAAWREACAAWGQALGADSPLLLAFRLAPDARTTGTGTSTVSSTKAQRPCVGHLVEDLIRREGFRVLFTMEASDTQIASCHRAFYLLAQKDTAPRARSPEDQHSSISSTTPGGEVKGRDKRSTTSASKSNNPSPRTSTFVHSPPAKV